MSTQPTAWIIGASSGLGASLATRLANQGYHVAVSARRVERLEALAQEHSNLVAFPLDVADHDAAQKCASDVLGALGKLDLVVFCAVSAGANSSMHESLAKGMVVGLLGASAALDPVIAHMKTRMEGHIALIGSPVGFRALPGTRAYGIVKSALHYFAELMKLELMSYNIHVQLILPGFVETELTQSNTFPMPFLMTLDDATDRIWRGIQNPKQFTMAFPKRLMWPMKLLCGLPDWIYHRLWAKIAGRLASKKAGK